MSNLSVFDLLEMSLPSSWRSTNPRSHHGSGRPKSFLIQTKLNDKQAHLDLRLANSGIHPFYQALTTNPDECHVKISFQQAKDKILVFALNGFTQPAGT